MWCLKLNKSGLKHILALFTMEYTTIKSIPITDKGIEQLRVHLIAKMNKLIEDRELCKVAMIENDETDDIEEIEKIINEFVNSLKTRRINK